MKQYLVINRSWGSVLWALLAVLSLTSARDGMAQETGDDAVSKFIEGSTAETIQTEDGVYLGVRLWAAKGDDGKESPIVVLIPARGQNQRQWYPFAKFLNDKGMAVCTFDLRGHGESRVVDPEIYQNPAEAIKAAEQQAQRGVREVLVPRGSRIRKLETEVPAGLDKIDQTQEFRNGKEVCFAMPKDLDAVKEFLILQNNTGKLNVRRLGVVAPDSASTILFEWFVQSEFRPKRERGFRRTEGDVRSIVLLNPLTNYRGFRTPTKFSPDADVVPILVYSAERGKSASEAERLCRLLKVPAVKEGDSRGPTNSNLRPGSGWFKVDAKFGENELLRWDNDELARQVGGFLFDTLREDKSIEWGRRQIDADEGAFGAG